MLILARTQDVEWRCVDGEIILLDLRRSCYLSLNRAGARLWPLIVEGTSQVRLVEELVTAYSVERDVAQADVERLVIQLTDAGLLAEV